MLASNALDSELYIHVVSVSGWVAISSAIDIVLCKLCAVSTAVPLVGNT
jgi:hypothetical protein